MRRDAGLSIQWDHWVPCHAPVPRFRAIDGCWTELPFRFGAPSQGKASAAQLQLGSSLLGPVVHFELSEIWMGKLWRGDHGLPSARLLFNSMDLLSTPLAAWSASIQHKAVLISFGRAFKVALSARSSANQGYTILDPS